MAYVGSLSLLNKVAYEVNLDPNAGEMWVLQEGYCGSLDLS